MSKKMKLTHGKKYFSPSQLKKLFISAGQFKAYLSRTFKTTTSMHLGSAIHTAILEPDLFDRRYVVMDDSKIIKEIGGKRPTSTKKYLEWMKSFQESCGDRKILTKQDKYIVDRITKNCEDTGVLDTFFSGGEAEKTITGIAKGFDKEFNALCIIDYDTDFTSVDLKTTSKPLHKFRFDANELGYDIQAKLTNSLNGKDFIFIAVQTVEPFDIGVYSASDAFMERGVFKINKALDNYNYFNKDGVSQVLEFEL